MAGNAKQTCVVIPPIRSFRRPVRVTASRTRGSSHALTTLRSMFSTPGSASLSSGRVGPHIIGAVDVSTTGTQDARGAGERDDIVAHLVRREISNARDEPGLMVDKQEYGRLRREALVGASPPALGLVYRLGITHTACSPLGTFLRFMVSLIELPLGCRYGPSHCPSERNIREPDYHGAASHEPSHARVPHSREAQEPVERVHPGTQNREHETQDGVEKRQLVAVRLCKEPVRQVHGDDCHNHDGDDQTGADRAEQSRRCQQAASNLAKSCRENEKYPRTEADAFEEAGRALEAVAAEPAKQLLRPVGSQSETDDQPCDQQCSVHLFVLRLV